MRRITFDLDVLRSFVQGIELGSYAKAADRLGRSTSAISAQLKKLEEQVGAPVLRKSGRGVVLTATGEQVFAYAHRLLALNDEAAAAVRGVDLAGTVRIGLQEDFGENLLTTILGDFARAHPQVRIEARVARNQEVLEGVAAGRVDLALAWEAGIATPYSDYLGELPMCWVGPADAAALALAEGVPVPLVAFEAPCLMRSAAITALEQAGLPWRMAFTSLGLGGIWAAVGAGLGLTVRTAAALPAQVRVRHDLPALPSVGLRLHRAEAVPSAVVTRLAEIVLARLAERVPTLGLRPTEIGMTGIVLPIPVGV